MPGVLRRKGSLRGSEQNSRGCQHLHKRQRKGRAKAIVPSGPGERKASVMSVCVGGQTVALMRECVEAEWEKAGTGGGPRTC